MAAVVVSMAAGLVAMAARLAPEWPEATQAVERAETLRATAAPLAQADAEAYAGVLAVIRLPREAESRDAELAAALSRAAGVPLAVAEVAAEVAALAALAVERGGGDLRGDAAVAAVLAEAGARGSAKLVAINLGEDEQDERVLRARQLAAAASEAARRALVTAS